MPTDTQTQTTPEAGFDPTGTLFSFWTQWMEQSARGTQAIFEAMQSAGDLQHLQRNWFEPIARSIEEFMRTPVFMEAMKRNFKVATDMKLLQDQFVRDGARRIGSPTAADITGLFDRLQGTERAIISRLRAIEDRLEAVEDKIHAAPAPRRSPNRSTDEAGTT